MVRFLQKWSCAIVGNSDCERAETLRLAQARKRERRRAAGGYCDEDILAVDLVLSNDEVCATLVEVAQANELPVGFFANLIWRESRFDHVAISRVGAMGIAQFMPDVADALRLDAFDPHEALAASGRLLGTVRALRQSWPDRGRLQCRSEARPGLAGGAREATEGNARLRQPDHPGALPFSSIERAERDAQAQKLAEESRIIAASARKASLNQRQAGAAKSKAAHQQRLNKVAQAKAR
jgi:hypothetical protein